MLETPPFPPTIAALAAAVVFASPSPAAAADAADAPPAGRLAYGKYRPDPWVAAGIGLAGPWVGATTYMSLRNANAPEAAQNASALLYVAGYGAGTIYAGDPIGASGPITAGVLLPLAAGAAGFLVGGLQGINQPPCGSDVACTTANAGTGLDFMVSRMMVGATVGTVSLFSGLHAYYTARRVGGWAARDEASD